MRARLSWFSLGGIFALLLGVNLLVQGAWPNAQIDLTQGRIYTLSKNTRYLLAGLHDPITLRLFYSPRLGSTLPAYGTLADHVQQMLRHYAQLSHGKIRLQFFDPEPYSETEDRALAAGLQGVPADEGGERVYFGLVGSNLLDDQRQIGFFRPDREQFLEYDLTRLVYELSNPKKPVVGVLSSLALDGDPRMMLMGGGPGAPGQPYVTMTELRQNFDIRIIAPDSQMIDQAVQVLLVAQAQHLPPQTLYAIDQFVMRGGRLMVMVDPQSEAETSQPGPMGAAPTDTSSDLAPLLHVWGVGYDKQKVVADLAGDWQVRATDPNDPQPAVNYIPWFNITTGISRTDPATADLRQVTVAAPGALTRLPGAPIDFSPLLRSSPASGLIDAASIRQNPDPAALLAGFKPSGGPYVIAARVHGVLASAFKGPPDLPKGVVRAADLPPWRASTKTAANLVVVADSDILADRFWVKIGTFFGRQDVAPFSDNGPFVANLLGNLAGGDVLIGLRGRGQTQRPFARVDRMREQAEAQFRRSAQSLQTRLAATEKQLAALRQGNAAPAEGATANAVITPAQQAAIVAAQAEILQTRQQLRRVQRQLRVNIARLEGELQLFDIVLVPLLVVLLAFLVAWLRRHRRVTRPGE